MDTLVSSQVVNNTTLGFKINNLLERRPVILQLLRFAAIGILNTAIDFIVLNYISKQFGVQTGGKLGLLNIPGFCLALVQSYYWNRYWAFGSQEQVNAVKNLIRLVIVGFIGTLAMALVLLGARGQAFAGYYLIIFAIYILVQIVLWKAFGFFDAITQRSAEHKFASFALVSVVGLVINSGLIAVITGSFALTQNVDLNKNLAKIIATGASLVWNFIGYKLFVFKK